MRKIFITALIFLAIGIAAGWLIFKSGGTKETSKERKILFYRAPMNPSMTSPVPKKDEMGMDYVPVYADEQDSTGKNANQNVQGIKIDPVTVQNIGVKTESVTKRKLSRTIRTTGTIAYDETKVFTINTKIMGWVEKLYVDYTGKQISKGQPLMDIYSPELVSTQEEYLEAIRYKQKMSGALSEAKNGAEDLIQSAKRRLLNWDISEQEISDLEKRGTPKKTMTIYSPVNGVVIEKMVLKGQNIMPGMELYRIADLSTMWVLADVYQYELSWVRTGQPVDLELTYLPGKTYKGKVTYIYPYLGMESKTVKVRVEVQNTPSIVFKQGMFATVKINSPLQIQTIAVPEEAVIRSGERNVVVLSLGGGYFDPREVKTGATADGYVQILDGIKEGDVVVTSSQFLIDSESNLKAAISQMSGHSGMNMSQPEGQEDKSMNKTEQHKESSPTDHSKMNNEQMKGMNMDNEGNARKNKQKKMDDSQMGNMNKGTDSPLIRKGVIDLESIDKNKDGKVFQDVMHWNVISDEPGKCPLCGMTLREVTLEEAKKNLVDHGFKVR